MTKTKQPTTRKIFSIAIHTGDTILLRGWGKTQAEAIKDLKKRYLQEAVESALQICRRSDNNYTDADVPRFVMMRMEDDTMYDNDRWSFDCYVEEHAPRPGDEDRWMQIDAYHWAPKYPVKLGL